MNTYTLTPLSGDIGRQVVDGFRDAIDIARDIAEQQYAHVVVRNERSGHVWHVAFPPAAPFPLCQPTNQEVSHMRKDYVAIVWEIGYGAGRDAEIRPDDDVDSFDDRVFPDAFSEALDAFPEREAVDLSDAVHDGIRDAYLEQLQY